MKQILTVLLAVLAIAAIGNLQSTHAQNPDITPSQETFVGLHTGCSISVPGSTKECKAGDGVWISENGGAYFHIQATTSTVSAVLTVNGKSPDSKGDVTLTATTTVASPTATTTLK